MMLLLLLLVFVEIVIVIVVSDIGIIYSNRIIIVIIVMYSTLKLRLYHFIEHYLIPLILIIPHNKLINIPHQLPLRIPILPTHLSHLFHTL